MNAEQMVEQCKPFLAYVVTWVAGLQPLDLASVLGGRPERVAVLCVDVTNGFCHEGPLASSRVGSIVEPIVALFRRARALGVEHFLLPYDAHDPDAVEFGSYPPHCMRDTSESETVPELEELPFSELFIPMPKNSIDSALGTDLDFWLENHPEVDTFIVVGDCTDLCTYQLAMHIRLRANECNQQVRVFLPEDGVDTYDLPVEVAQEIGAVPHDGNLLHYVFLYHMMLNGIEVISTVR